MANQKTGNLQPWGMSGMVQCQACGAILSSGTKHHHCNPPEGYVLRDGVWVEE